MIAVNRHIARHARNDIQNNVANFMGKQVVHIRHNIHHCARRARLAQTRMHETRIKPERYKFILPNLPSANIFRRLAAAKANHPSLKNLQHVFRTCADFVTVRKSIKPCALGKRKRDSFVNGIRILRCRQSQRYLVSRSRKSENIIGYIVVITRDVDIATRRS